MDLGGLDQEEKGATVGVIVDQFSAYQHAGGLSAKTISRRRTALRGLEQLVGDLLTATPEDVGRYLSTKPSPKTKHAYRSDLIGFYDWAINRGHARFNPARSTRSIRLPKPIPRPIGPEVRTALLVGSRRTRRMVALGLYAGLRCAEIAAIDGSDLFLHLDPPMLHVRNGKGGKDRAIPIHPELVELLRGAPAAGPLFPGQRGNEHVSGGSVSALLSRHLKRCGIDATPHQLRHTFGTEMTKMARGNLVVVADAMGHSSMQTTRGYVGWSGQAYDVIAAMYGDGGGDAA
jgi:integrase/recombinase XerD